MIALEQLFNLKRSVCFRTSYFWNEIWIRRFPKAEIAVRRVKWASFRISGIVTEPGFIPLVTITTGGDMCFAEPIRVSSSFQKDADGIDVHWCSQNTPQYRRPRHHGGLSPNTSPLEGKRLAKSTHKPIHSKPVDNDWFLSEIVNHVRKREWQSFLLSSKTESHEVIFQGMVDHSGASWIKRIRRVERMQMLGDRSMCSRSLSPKNSTQLGVNDRNFEFPF
jgi:hypothetical protein